MVLLVVVFASMLGGVLCPGICRLFQTFPLYVMMFLLFLSFLSIELNSIWQVLRYQLPLIVWLSLLKLLIIPLLIYQIFALLFPSYAPAALLLGAVSTGVVAPFVSSWVGANTALVLVLVVITSLFVPVTMPALVKLLLERTAEISLPAMIRMLSLLVFVPFLAVQVIRRTLPRIVPLIHKARFPLSLMSFAVINLGVFSRYSEFFHQQPAVILEAAIVAMILGGVFLIMGLASCLQRPMGDQLASAITLGNINNVLVIVFASEFFGPLEPTLAAFYMIPFFGLIFPMRVYSRLRP
jgi:BASS family bile acid:Na+ symporter